MIQTVIKRDGRVVGFNEEKIVTAIRKAMLHTDKGEDLHRSYIFQGKCTNDGGSHSGCRRNGTDEE